MKGLARICRLIIGAVFIFSGFAKLLAPVGTSLIIKEYLFAFHLDALVGISLVAGIVLALAEFLTGVALLLRLRIRIFSWIALIMVSVFTLITLYLAIFNPIDDCGCFGEAVHLSNWQTFFKNLILLPCALIIFLSRKKISEFRYPVWEWIFLGLFAALAAFILLRTMLVAPMQENTVYAVGNEVVSEPDENAGSDYETVFIYEKDGERQTFTLDSLPDDSWTYVDAVTTSRSDEANASDADFKIVNPVGIDITEEILSKENLLLMSIYYPEKFDGEKMESISKVKEVALQNGMEFALVASAPMAGLPTDVEANTADLKLLMTFNRSNGGVTYLNDGLIVRKWAYPAVAKEGPDFDAPGDYEMELMGALNRQRVALEVTIVVFLLLCLLKFFFFFRKKE